MTTDTSRPEPALAFVAPDEHAMIRDAAARLLDDHAADRQAAWTALHAALAETGLLAAPMAGVDGGLDDARVAAIVAEELGARALVSPFTVSAAVAARALGRAGWPGFAAIAPRLAAGELVASVAWYEDDGLPLGTAPAARLAADGDRLLLDGAKRAVPFGADAGLLLVPAHDDAGLVVVAIDNADVPTRRVERRDAIDGLPVADIVFASHPVDRTAVVARGADAAALLDWMRDAWLATSDADALGAMRRVVAMTGEYLGLRQQFGMPIGTNQALRHRFVDLHLAIREVEAVVEFAAVAIDDAPAAERARAVAQAHWVTVRAAFRIAQECVQMHGGIGMAAETPVGGYFKRLLGLALRCGDEDAALARLATAG